MSVRCGAFLRTFTDFYGLLRTQLGHRIVDWAFAGEGRFWWFEELAKIFTGIILYIAKCINDPVLTHMRNMLMKSAVLTSVKVNDPVFASRVEMAFGPMLEAVVEQTESTGRIGAFDLKWKVGDPCKPHVYWDSDVAKVLEGIAYILALKPDAELDKLYDDWVSRIVSAQQPDGYLNVYFTIVEPEKRFAYLNWAHELYCAGHLIEAAVAGFELLGKRKFLDAMCRYADYIDSVFGLEPGKRRGWPGHQELELALVRLYRATGVERYLRLAQYFINDRGTLPNVFLEEGCPANELAGRQADIPIREMTELRGHAVRALYMCSGAADVAVESGDEELFALCEKIFDHLAEHNTYITGGVGSTPVGEAVTADFDLPEGSAYAESCAAIALAFFALRMLNYSGNVKYAEILERVLYNNCLSGVGNSGKAFFYANPLQMIKDKVDTPCLDPRLNGVRQEWFYCSCCPTNYLRFFPTLGSYLWSTEEKAAVLHIPAASEISLPGFGAVVSGAYPADGKIVVTMSEDSDWNLKIRIPLWAENFSLKVRGEKVECSKGYVHIPGPWKKGDRIELDLEIKAHLVFPRSEVADSAGRAAIMRGPLVYAVESSDNPRGVHGSRIRSDVAFEEISMPQELFSTLPALRFDAEFRTQDEKASLYSAKPPVWEKGKLVAIPYYLWQNRGPVDMRVFIPFV